MSLERFFDHNGTVVHIRQIAVHGSAPRETGAQMFVSATAFHGTIGGGQLEYMAIDKARALLRRGAYSTRMNVPLGPEIGQCCGGRVELTLEKMTADDQAAACKEQQTQKAACPHVYILGAGHVGRALAMFFQHLPVRCVLIDSRAQELAMSQADVRHCLSALPESDIRRAPAGSAFIVLTHDHALDFLLTTQALARGDAAYVGLIGSATKRARFETYCRHTQPYVSPASLVCPIGTAHAADKRPQVIASFVVAEVMARLIQPHHHIETAAL